MAEPGDLCLTAEERADWDKWNRRTGPHIAQYPCVDCTVAFAAEMALVGLCNGTPGSRYCARCRKWWPLDNDHWVTKRDLAGSKRRDRVNPRRTTVTHLQCRFCVRRQQNHRAYLRRMSDPAKKARRRNMQTARERERMSDPVRREQKQRLDRERNRRKYQTDPAYREACQVRNRKRDSRGKA